MRLNRPIAAATLAALALLSTATTAAADTAFGGDPTQAITPGLSCERGAPPYFHGAASCLWYWSGPSGSDNAPFPETTGGSGTVTSVTLPAMPNPGPMQAVVLTGTIVSSYEPTRPEYHCCKVKAMSSTFTVPANQVTTVPLNLAVSSEPVPNFSVPGSIASFDGLAISVLSPSASLPLLETGRVVAGFGGDLDKAYFPAPSAPYSEYVEPTDPTGYELLARFNIGSTPPPAPPPAPAPAPTPGPAAGGGLKFADGAARVGADGKTVSLGTATDPPTATTTQTLSLPDGAARASAAKPHKPVVLAKGKTTIPAGKTVALKVQLNDKARARLHARGKLTATLTVVAANAQGETQTRTRQVTIDLARRKRG